MNVNRICIKDVIYHKSIPYFRLLLEAHTLLKQCDDDNAILIIGAILNEVRYVPNQIHTDMLRLCISKKFDIPVNSQLYIDLQTCAKKHNIKLNYNELTLLQKIGNLTVLGGALFMAGKILG